jgi:hypothetical protein
MMNYTACVLHLMLLGLLNQGRLSGGTCSMHGEEVFTGC